MERAEHQDIRELHVGLLNMMPDAALLVTEKQYMRLIGACNRITQIYVYPFSVPGLARSEEALAHIEAFYADFEAAQGDGPGRAHHQRRQRDQPLARPGALLGAAAGGHRAGPPTTSPASSARAWPRTRSSSTSTASTARPSSRSCGASTATASAIARIPLTQDVNTRFDAPHSRWNDIPRASWDACRAAGAGRERGGRRAPRHQPGRLPHRLLPGTSRVRPQQPAQGVQARGRALPRRASCDAPPPYPEHYLTPESDRLAQSYLRDALAAQRPRRGRSGVPGSVDRRLSWTTPGGTRAERSSTTGWGWSTSSPTSTASEPFMPGVDPDDPLGLRPPRLSTRRHQGRAGEPPDERRDPRHPRRLRDRPHHQVGRGADLPDRRLRVRRRPARRRPLQPGGRGQHLHPHHEPDRRTCSSSAWRRSRAASPAWRCRPARRPSTTPS